MAKVFIEESSLTAIGEAIRSKTGKTDLLSPASMASEITSITTGGGGDVEEIVLSGNCSYACANPAWNALFDKVRTEEILNGEQMFSGNTRLESVPFDLNFSSTNIPSCNYMFNSTGLTTCPMFKSLNVGNFGYVFLNCDELREIPDENFEILSVNATNSYAYRNSIFSGCYSLRRAPMQLLNALAKGENVNQYYYYALPYNMLFTCYALDEFVGFHPPVGNYTSNAFYNTFQACNRLKDMTFELDENGQPYVRSWSNQTIDLTSYVGYASNTGNVTNYNAGIRYGVDEVNNDSSYQAQKNTETWYSKDINYSRYDHDSAVRTINSLPDVSSGSGNTIKFKGASGALTDAGAINTLTEEEIAVATAKGWTISFV